MSNVYIQEPPTTGKVLLKTSFGDLDIELWTKEAPKTCRNFIKLCMDGYYESTIFHRVVKGFIVQGGDPTGTGEGGESIYGAPFKDEFHTRLRFCRRGLVAMANAGKDDNGSQFFITLGATPELQNKHTIFGKVAGDTIYNVLKLEEVEVDADTRPVYSQKILSAEILLNPFPDLVPESRPKETKKESKKSKSAAGVKNFKLLSFGEEAEEDEAEYSSLNKKLHGKSKSAHDNLQDPKLSTNVDEQLKGDVKEKAKKEESSDSDSSEGEEIPEKRRKTDDESSEMKKRIIDKLKSGKSCNNEKIISSTQLDTNKTADSSDEEYNFMEDRDKKRKAQIDAIKNEIKEVKSTMQQDKKRIHEEKLELSNKEEEQKKKKAMYNDYIEIQKQYKEAEKKIPAKGVSRENFTLELLKKFRSKIKTAKESGEANEEQKKDDSNDVDDDNDDSNNWMAHSLHYDNPRAILAKDASTKDDDWFEIYDPRNPINKRRRGEQSKKK